jgi:hypothetical protein
MSKPIPFSGYSSSVIQIAIPPPCSVVLSAAPSPCSVIPSAAPPPPPLIPSAALPPSRIPSAMPLLSRMLPHQQVVPANITCCTHGTIYDIKAFIDSKGGECTSLELHRRFDNITLELLQDGGIIYRPTHAIGQVKLSDIDMRIPSASPAAMSIAANRNVSLRSVRFLLQRDGKLDKFRALLNTCRQEVMNYIQANISGTHV